MLTIRRLYLYGMSAVMLAVLASGLRLLLTVLFDALGLNGAAALGASGSREQLSLAGALVGVGLPVWAIHWWLVGRSLQGSGPVAVIERTSTTRAAFLSIVLAASLLFLAAAAADLVRLTLQVVLDLHPAYQSGDIAGSTATILVAGTVWGFHVLVRLGDMASGPMAGGAILWPRIYLYGTQLGALLAAAGAFGTALNGIADRLAGAAGPGGTDYLAELIPGNVATVVVAALVFVVHALYTRGLLGEAGWRGVSERSSRLRIAFLAILLAAGLASTVAGLGDSLRAVILAIIGGTSPELGPSSAPGGLARATLVPIVALVPWLVAAWYGRRRLLHEAAGSGDAGRAASTIRLEQYIGSMVGLAFGAVSIGWLVGLALDVVLGGERTAFSPDGTRYELASFLPTAVLGSALWAWRWWRVIEARAAQPLAEAASGIRRAALLAILGVSLTAAVVSLAMVLYRLFGSVLGVSAERSIASELSTPLGALVVAAAVALYHGLLVREDARLRGSEGTVGPAGAAEAPMASGAAASASGDGAVPASAAVASGAPPAMDLPATRLERRLRLTAASAADLDAALAAARLALPSGARLEAEDPTG